MPVTDAPAATSPADSPSPAVRAAHRRVERARTLGQSPERGFPSEDSAGAAARPGVRPRPPAVGGTAAARRSGARSAGAPRAGSPRAGAHVVDRALAYRALARGGTSAAAVARRVRKSKGHVSILLRLGAAVEGMEPDEVAALRTPAVTWRLVQRLVRGDTRVQSAAERTAGVLALRRALRDAVAGFSSHTVDRRRHRKGRAPGAPALERFDPGAFAADPAGAVARHAAQLAAVHEAFARQALRMLDHALAAERLAAVPLSALARLSRPHLAAIAARGRDHLTADQRQAVDALEVVGRLLSQGVHLAGGAPTRRDPPTGVTAAAGLAGGRARPAAAPPEVTADDIDADLAD